MRNNILKLLIFTLILVLSIQVRAGNEQRIGQAGASELLINPWAQSSGLGSANIACIRGHEGVFGNVAGTVHINGTELIFSNSQWFRGSDISINAFGISQKIGDVGVLSLSVMAMNWGEIVTTTVETPDGDGTTFNPRYNIIGISYAKEFSNSIFGGVTVKIINENIPNLKGTGVAFDAGIQYITGKTEQIKFGITMKNVGPTMKLNGDGMSFRGSYTDGPTMTVAMRSAEYELPSLITLGMSYTFDIAASHDIIAMGSFTENSFSKNQFNAGLEYNFKNILILRAGYIYEQGITSSADRSTAFTGPAAGFTFQAPFVKGKAQTFAIDYSYRDTNPFKGVHSIGVRINL